MLPFAEWNLYMESRRLQDCSPRLCRLRTDGLVTTSKCWTYRSHAGDMGPVSLVVWRQQRVALPPLLQWLAQERNWVRTRGSVNRRVVDYIGSPFLGSSGSVHRCWRLHERLLCVDRMRYVWSRTICRLSAGCVWHLGRVFPCRVYIDSNHRDSWIWVSFVFVAVIM
jgi:hypothetical protein